MEIGGNRFLQLPVKVLGAADEADRGHAVAALFHGFLSGGDEALTVGEAQIIVRAEVQRLAAIFQGDFRPLGRSDDAFFLIKSGRLDGAQLILKISLEFSVHNNYGWLVSFCFQIYGFSRDNAYLF